MNIFVTGATGVLGRSTTRQLAEGGNRIRALARSAASADAIRALGIEAVEGSLFDSNSIGRATAGCEAILHLATRVPPSNKMGRPESWIENDRIRREGTRNLVTAAIAGGTTTFIYPSVCFVYADSAAEWIDASSAPVAVAPFLESTLSAEREIQRFNESGGRGISLRMGAFYGPQSVQTKEQLKLAKKGMVIVFGEIGAYHSTVWIDDAARAIVSALACPAGVYDVVDDTPLTNQQAIVAMARSVGRKKLWRVPEFLLRWTAGKALSDVLGRSQRVSNRRFKEATGWCPRVASPESGWIIAQEARR
jgi:nucleoside-diphosphate-sugar epimerase